MANKISRLSLLKDKWERRLATIAKREAISSVNPKNEDANKQPEKIILRSSGSGISVYSPASGQVFEQEEA